MRLRAGLLAAFAALALATGAAAQSLLLGVGSNGGPAYQPLGTTYLAYNALGTNSALGVTNTKTLTHNFWLFGTYNTPNVTNAQGDIFWGNAATNCEVGSSAPGLCGGLDSAAGRFQLNYNNSAGLVVGTDAVKFVATAGAIGSWHDYLISFDTASGAYAVYVDGVITSPAISLAANSIPDLNNSGGFHIGGSSTAQPAATYSWVAETAIAEVSVVCTGAGAPATMNGIAVTCAGANTIPPEILAKFISAGKPVDMGTGCAAPFGGRTAEVCVRGSDIANTGSGGALAPLVTTATYGGLFAAPYGPAGVPAHQATMKWLQAKNNATVTSLTMTTAAGANPIAVGDLIVIVAGISNSSGNTNYALTCPAGFTQVGPVNDTVQSMNAEVCYKILTGGDTSGAYVIGWNTGGGVRTHDWVMADYGNVASVDQSGFKYNGTTAVTNHPTASGLVTTSPNETVISALVDWNAASNKPWNPPGSGTLRYRLPDVGSPLQMMLADEYAVANGANPQRTFTSASAVQSATFTLTLVPN